MSEKSTTSNNYQMPDADFDLGKKVRDMQKTMDEM